MQIGPAQRYRVTFDLPHHQCLVRLNRFLTLPAPSMVNVNDGQGRLNIDTYLVPDSSLKGIEV